MVRLHDMFENRTSALAPTLGYAVIGVLIASSSLRTASIGVTPLTRWDVLGILSAPLLAVCFRPPRREGFLFLWVFSAGLNLLMSLAMDETARTLPRLVGGIALLVISRLVFVRARNIRRSIPGSEGG
jgi:hypothetical protein